MNEINASRIIGDSLEINADITATYFNSKLPRFISNILAKHYRNKLIKLINKLKTGNKILDIYNISEFLSYVYNNYPPNGTFENVESVRVMETSNRIIGVIKNQDKWYTKISIIRDMKSDIDFEFFVYDENKSVKRYDFKSKIIKTDKSEIEEEVSDLNNILLDNIVKYITDSILRYNE